MSTTKLPAHVVVAASVLTGGVVLAEDLTALALSGTISHAILRVFWSR